MRDKNLNNFAVYFNGEYIGEARAFKIFKGYTNKTPLLKIEGKYRGIVND